MTQTIWTVLELVDGNQYISVGTKDTERAAKLLRTKLRGSSDRTYEIQEFTVTTPEVPFDPSYPLAPTL